MNVSHRAEKTNQPFFTLRTFSARCTRCIHAFASTLVRYLQTPYGTCQTVAGKGITSERPASSAAAERGS